jgi:hypothetical protein
MSENNEPTQVPFDGEAGDRAVLLLEAAQSLELEPYVVVASHDHFSAPHEVVEKAFGKAQAKAFRGDQDAEPEVEEVHDFGKEQAPEPEAEATPEPEPTRAPAKKAAAKRAPAKKAAAKKTAGK